MGVIFGFLLRPMVTDAGGAADARNGTDRRMSWLSRGARDDRLGCMNTDHKTDRLLMQLQAASGALFGSCSHTSAT